MGPPWPSRRRRGRRLRRSRGRCRRPGGRCVCGRWAGGQQAARDWDVAWVGVPLLGRWRGGGVGPASRRPDRARSPVIPGWQAFPIKSIIPTKIIGNDQHRRGGGRNGPGGGGTAGGRNAKGGTDGVMPYGEGGGP